MVFAMTAMPAFADYTDYTAEKAQETTAITDLPVKESLGKLTDGEIVALDSNFALPDFEIEVAWGKFASLADIQEWDENATAANIGVLPANYASKKYSFNASADFSQIQTFDLELILAANKAVGEYWFTMTSTPKVLDSAVGSELYFLDDSDPTTYLVKINVTVDADGSLIISQVRVYDEENNKIYDDEGVTRDEKGNDVPRQDTVRNVEFMNLTNCTTLIITNHIDGSDIAKTTEFTYYINIPIGGTTLDLEEDAEIPATIWKYDEDTGELKGQSTTLKVSGDKADMLKKDDTPEENVIKLADGEHIDIDVPEGMIFGVVQEDPTTGVLTTHGYTVTDDNGNQENTTVVRGEFIKVEDTSKSTGCYDISDDEGNDLDTAYNGDNNEKVHNGQVGVKNNTVDFYNYKGHEIDTGISMDVIPYVMVVMAAAALAVLMISKKKTDR
jgi:hypothetical protein